jgi:aryl-alcohol dehydrogenase-like predicted oxidoreductase
MSTAMQYRTLPGTDIEVSAIALGCMSLVPNETYAGIDESQAHATVHTAIDAGITLFDNAPAYGRGEAERVLGRALIGRRDQVLIATKAGGRTLGADEIAADCDASLSRLRTDVIDLYQIHWPRRTVPLDETIRAMEKLVDAGKVRAIGVCNFGPLDLSELALLTHCCTNQVAYNLLARAVEFEIVDICLAHDIGVLCYSPVAQGLLAGKFRSADEVPESRARTRHFSGGRPQARHGEPGFEQETFDAIDTIRGVAQRLSVPMADLSLAWLLHQPFVTCVLVGASRPEQIARNVSAAALDLSDDVVAELSSATDMLKQQMGPSIDMWAPPAEARTR